MKCSHDCKAGWYDDWDHHNGSHWKPCPIHNPEEKSQLEFKWGELGIDLAEARDPNYKRIDWDDYFMGLVNLLRKKSPDANTQHACVAVRDKVVIGTGFNGYPSGSDDANLPNLRPHKYSFINHAEEALIFNCAKLGVALDGCTLFVSGQCCCHCIRKLISVGIKDVVIGPITHVSSSKEDLLYQYWIESHGIKVREYQGKAFVE